VGLARWEAKTLHAFGVDEIACPVLALRQILFFVWITLNEHKWVNSRERRGDAGPCAYVHPIPPKHPVASVIGFLKGKSAIAIARLCGKERNFTGEHLWARGYAVSTVGFELEQVRQYIREQEDADGQSGQF
jgi:putative transposase